MQSVLRLHKESTMCSVFGSWKPVSSAWEQQLTDTSQQGQEILDTMPLEVTTKQRHEDCDGEH
jgi:hypothetical protein